MTPEEKAARLPYWPRLMTRKMAALYCSLPEKAFEREVAIGTMPAPLLFGRKSLWDRFAIDDAIDGNDYDDGRAQSGLYRGLQEKGEWSPSMARRPGQRR